MVPLSHTLFRTFHSVFNRNQSQKYHVFFYFIKPYNSSVSPLGPFTDPNDRFPYSFIYLRPGKRKPFRSDPPHIGHLGSNPHLPWVGRCSIKQSAKLKQHLKQNLMATRISLYMYFKNLVF